MHRGYRSKTLALGAVHDLFVKPVEQLLNFTLILVLRQTVWHIAEAIEIVCRLAKHFKVGMLANELVQMADQVRVVRDIFCLHAPHYGTLAATWIWEFRPGLRI